MTTVKPAALRLLLLSLVFAASAFGQLAQIQSSVQANNTDFQLDLSSVPHFDTATITIENTGSEPVIMPEIDTMGTSPATNSQAILAWLQTQGSSSDSALAESGWQYVLAHMSHLCWAVSPYEGAYEAGNPWRILRGYGFGCCDQAASLLAWVWHVEGFQSRIVYLTGHVVAEVYYGGAWHMYDADHRVFYTAPDGTVASVATIVANPSLIATGQGSGGLDPIGYPVVSMESLYANSTVTYGTPNYSSSIYAAPNYALAPGELLLLYSGNITADLIHGYGGGSGFGPSAVTSATLVQTVDFSDPQWTSRVYSVTGMAVNETDSGFALSGSGNIILKQDWPNPAFDLQLDGNFNRESSNTALNVYFSADGVNWSLPFHITTSAGTFQSASLNLTGVARGAYSGYIKIQANGNAGISSLKITSNVQVSKAVFPALIPGAVNSLTYRDGSPDTQARNLSVRLAVYDVAPAPVGMSLPLIQNTTVAQAASVANLEANLRAPLTYSPWLAYGSSAASATLWQAQQRGDVLQVVAPAPGYLTLGANLSWSANNTGLTTWSLAKREPASLNFDWLLSPVTTSWLGNMTAQLPSTGDQAIFSSTAGGNVQLLGRPIYQGATASSLLPESPVYSIPQGYGAKALVDGNLRTLAYPGGPGFDYVVNLGNLAHVSAVWLNWGLFGSNPIYIQNWMLYGRQTTADSWQTLAQGGLPGAETSTVSLDTYASQLRITATGPNWVGMYELEAAASVPLPLTAASNVDEQPSTSHFGAASALADGNDNTFAYPGSTFNDYTLDPGNNAYIDQVSIVWGYFGTSSLYINSWRLYGQKQLGSTWQLIAQGGFPNTTKSVVPVQDQYRRLRIAANGANWIGIYEVQAYGNLLAQ